jgi:hypothetical protein
MALAASQRARDTGIAVGRLEGALGRRSRFDSADVADELFMMSAGSRGGRICPEESVARILREVEEVGARSGEPISIRKARCSSIAKKR